jgi:hypothetical protein
VAESANAVDDDVAEGQHDEDDVGQQLIRRYKMARQKKITKNVEDSLTEEERKEEQM